MKKQLVFIFSVLLSLNVHLQAQSVFDGTNHMIKGNNPNGNFVIYANDGTDYGPYLEVAGNTFSGYPGRISYVSGSGGGTNDIAHAWGMRTTAGGWSTMMYLLKNGNLGIGTATPNAPLQLPNTWQGTNRKIVLFETVNNDHQFYGFGIAAGILRYQVDATTSKHVFYAGTSSTNSAELMRIVGNGNVGIGNAAPTALLDLSRTESTTGRNVMLKLGNNFNPSGTNEPTILFDNGVLTGSGPYGGLGWSMGAQVAGSSYFRIGTYSGTPTTTFQEFVRITDVGALAIGSTSTPTIPTNAPSSGAYKFYTNGNANLNGSVVIGDASHFTYSTPFPASYNLFVENGIITEKVKVAVKTTSDWSDFVFEKNYKLTPLQELESFINKNKHLPGIPSAQDVVDNGINVAEMDANLLRKVEELTLYIIEMNKQIQDLKNENNKLKKQ